MGVCLLEVKLEEGKEREAKGREGRRGRTAQDCCVCQRSKHSRRLRAPTAHPSAASPTSKPAPLSDRFATPSTSPIPWVVPRCSQCSFLTPLARCRALWRFQARHTVQEGKAKEGNLFCSPQHSVHSQAHIGPAPPPSWLIPAARPLSSSLPLSYRRRCAVVTSHPWVPL
jgi:hypothetical protein